MFFNVIRLSSFTRIHFQQGSSHIQCGHWEWLVLWRWGRLSSWLFVKEIKASIEGLKLIWQCGLTHDGGTSAFVTCDHLECLPHVLGVIWCWDHSPVSPDATASPPWCQLSVWLWECCLLPCHLTYRALTSPLIQAFWLGNDLIVFVITASSTHLVVCGATDDVKSSKLVWFLWVAASVPK